MSESSEATAFTRADVPSWPDMGGFDAADFEHGFITGTIERIFTAMTQPQLLAAAAYCDPRDAEWFHQLFLFSIGVSGWHNVELAVALANSPMSTTWHVATLCRSHPRAQVAVAVLRSKHFVIMENAVDVFGATEDITEQCRIARRNVTGLGDLDETGQIAALEASLTSRSDRQESIIRYGKPPVLRALASNVHLSDFAASALLGPQDHLDESARATSAALRSALASNACVERRRLDGNTLAALLSVDPEMMVRRALWQNPNLSDARRALLDEEFNDGSETSTSHPSMPDVMSRLATA